MESDVLFDYPCSDTFRRYEDELLDRPSPIRCESLKEARAREDHERYLQSRAENEENSLKDVQTHSKAHGQLWAENRRLKSEILQLRSELNRAILLIQRLSHQQQNRPGVEL